MIDGKIPYDRKTLELLQDLENELVKTKTNFSIGGAVHTLKGLANYFGFANPGTFLSSISGGVIKVAASAAGV